MNIITEYLNYLQDLKSKFNEGSGMISRIPSGGLVEDVEEDSGELEGEELHWSLKL